ncbi:uncharacterized protein K460DRAFT_67248 [Cucurbitaria berberidis CBS 394.84]|uniref:Uncharacterized protein n=1 Tax=Cucurbitaria berberidis CBS 394.84 TaxID=1168544 RepID=A0A9P4GN11_9PLEO|nr:uncharacterized protein K460DRAFT_67248 [Cucurbitaria berberidis CBS 394.84]KAF1848036.1 hypothetical protein K460DRAFT_67248 [Cucurbitaria berberidis CBS 394.84]
MERELSSGAKFPCPWERWTMGAHSHSIQNTKTTITAVNTDVKQTAFHVPFSRAHSPPKVNNAFTHPDVFSSSSSTLRWRASHTPYRGFISYSSSLSLASFRLISSSISILALSTFAALASSSRAFASFSSRCAAAAMAWANRPLRWRWRCGGGCIGSNMVANVVVLD